jgi:putative membrane protein
MPKIPLHKHFNWKILLLRILINALAIAATALLLPKIYFTQLSVVNILIIGIALGLLNAIIKPLLLFLTAQLFFATFGILVILINTVILYLIGFFFPNIFTVDGFGWALVGGTVLGLIGNSLENLLGLTPPIVPDEERELKQRITEQNASPIQQWMKQPKPIPSNVDTQSIEEVTAARAALDVINASAGPPTSITDTSLETETIPGETFPLQPEDRGGEA